MSKKEPIKRIAKPLIKYPGGKEKEVRIIAPRLPNEINNYYEPFFGGGAVYFILSPGNSKFINDKSEDLISFYRCVKEQNEEFFTTLRNWNERWKDASARAKKAMPHLRDLYDHNEEPDTDDRYLNELLKTKFKHIAKKAEESGSVEAFEDNIEAAYKQELFLDARSLYNAKKEYDAERAALFVLMRQYGFSGMFRYNAAGEFNIPYGGLAYNDKYLDERLKLMQSQEVLAMLNKTEIGNLDFYDFMQLYPPQKGDFVFVDQPYDTTFSSYSNNDFDKDDQTRLAEYLIEECQGNWMIVIKATDFIRGLYPEDKACANGDIIHIYEFGKRYDVCIKGRNNQNCEHLVITNYRTPADMDQESDREENDDGTA